MKQMDEMKLRSIFKDQVSEDVPLTTSAPVTPSNPQASDADETNIDEEPHSAKMIANLKQKVCYCTWNIKYFILYFRYHCFVEAAYFTSKGAHMNI